MRKTLLEDLIKHTEPSDNLIIVFDVISGHGGYSAGQTNVRVKPNAIKCFEDYISVKLDNKNDISFDTDTYKPGILYTEYSQIKMVLAEAE